MHRTVTVQNECMYRYTPYCHYLALSLFTERQHTTVRAHTHVDTLSHASRYVSVIVLSERYVLKLAQSQKGPHNFSIISESL